MGGTRYSGIIILVLLGFLGSIEAQLVLGFYSKNCPRAEKIVHDFVNMQIHNAPTLAAALIRMHFHDCFIRVCVKLNSSFHINFFHSAIIYIKIHVRLYPGV
jgi:peroxidase